MRSCARTEGAGDHGRRGHPVANNGRGTSFGWGGEIASGAKEFGQSPTRGRTEDAAAENPQEGYSGAAGRPQLNVPIPPPAPSSPKMWQTSAPYYASSALHLPTSGYTPAKLPRLQHTR